MGKLLYDKNHVELYRKNPSLAYEAMNRCLQEGDQAGLLMTLRYLALAHGGMQNLAQQARLNPTQIYRTLSPEGNPALNNLRAILQAQGLQLQIVPVDK